MDIVFKGTPAFSLEGKEIIKFFKERDYICSMISIEDWKSHEWKNCKMCG